MKITKRQLRRIIREEKRRRGAIDNLGDYAELQKVLKRMVQARAADMAYTPKDASYDVLQVAQFALDQIVDELDSSRGV